MITHTQPVHKQMLVNSSPSLPMYVYGCMYICMHVSCVMCVHREKISVFVDHDAEEKYLKLEELGSVLSALPGGYSVLVCRL